ncbi:ATP-dependent DNA ligase [Yangia mangrovi]|uniref:DNA ligase (ATP) n=1 Tax=Alloyangia mangrovi TaxID=1779329 RepID=A0A2A3JSZ3_9RHOB|nr:ATP-dependent DNA ligase [Alloyangia mangrovi]MCT4372485.1 ATP-dependent DNA ligase [Alloyangia mangrovi]
MKDFARLFTKLDQTTRTSEKTSALTEFFKRAPEADRLWAVALFSGRRPKRAVTTTLLREWAAERAGIPLWLFEESYPIVGDLAETIALILPPAAAPEERDLSAWIGVVRGLAGIEPEARKAAVLDAWDHLDPTERFLFNKLITGGFRIGISRKLMTRALAEATGVDEPAMALRLMGSWQPEDTTWDQLTAEEDAREDESRPYPFCLASPLEAEAASLGNPGDWLAEWKWDGIRGQLILRGGVHHLWSRGEELITDRFPEFARTPDFLPPGTVLDGEILAWKDGAPLPFAQLQPRIGRKSVPKKLLTEAPVRMLAYDLLEHEGEDIRALPLSERRARLDAMLSGLPGDAAVMASPLLTEDAWGALAARRESARSHRSEGLMLKHRDSAYQGGRRRGDWWKWKLDPLSVDAVMIYAQQGHGRRANLFTDFTFAVKDGNGLVPFTKAYSGLTDAEFDEITRWVKRNTQQRFGPVRQVTPELVFEIAFEGIQASPRHKSGIALRFPRMARWRRDKPVDEIDTLEGLQALLVAYG